MTVEMNVNSYFEIDTETGIISGNTYKSREWIKENFKAIWNSETKCWKADPAKVAGELAIETYYKKFIVSTKSAPAEKPQQTHTAKDGLCPYCHTYCYGDCAANRTR